MKKFLKDYELYVIPIVVVMVILFGIFVVIGNFYSSGEVVSIKYSGNQIISISNSLPMTDVVGKGINFENHKAGITGYLEFEVKSNVSRKVKYDIYLTKDDLENEVPIKFVKLYLTDENDKVIEELEFASVLTYYDLDDLSDSNDKLLYSGTLKDKESKKFKLRMWVADTYELTTDEKKFSVKLDIKKK